MATTTDKRRVILDGAVRVFARQGFHTCRVADIADEAGVAYGLVYHYFSSKEQILDTLFLERWSIMLTAIEEADASAELTGREKLRAANTFGRTHFGQIEEAHVKVASIIAHAQQDGVFRASVEPIFGARAFFGLIEQVLTTWIFEGVSGGVEELDRVKTEVVEMLCGGLEVPGN
jgi:TetR/AcrR family fatty acid metabolism transcriptional regulator